MSRPTEIWNCMHCGEIVERKDMDNHRCKMTRDGYLEVRYYAWKEVLKQFKQLQTEFERIKQVPESLWKANVNLRETNKQFRQYISEIKQREEKYIDALRKLEWDSLGYCNHCNRHDSEGHKNDCDFVKLCGSETVKPIRNKMNGLNTDTIIIDELHNYRNERY